VKNLEEVKNILENFYSLQKSYKVKRNKPFNIKSITNFANGLGDHIILTALGDTHQIKSELLSSIDKKYLSFNTVNSFEGQIECISLLSQNDWGGGHCIQRLQKSLGLKPIILPKPNLIKDNVSLIKKKVFVHLENGTDWKRPIPNSLDESSKNLVINFFNENQEYTPYYFNNDLGINQLIKILSECEYFLGIDSGPMHVAAALEIKSIIIINDPTNNIYLPKIKECEIPNSEWLYPQNVHLNRVETNELVPIFSKKNLKDAFEGKIYPYWKTKYLNILEI